MLPVRHRPSIPAEPLSTMWLFEIVSAVVWSSSPWPVLALIVLPEITFAAETIWNPSALWSIVLPVNVLAPPASWTPRPALELMRLLENVLPSPRGSARRPCSR